VISGESNYTFRASEDVLAQGRDNVVAMSVELGGTAVTVSAATFTLLPPGSDTPVISAATVSILSPPTYTIPAAAIAGTSRVGTGWQQVWALTISGRVYTQDRETVVAVYPPTPTLAQSDLTDLHADLPTLMGRGRPNMQGVMDASWSRILRRWRSEGGFLWRLRSRDALQDAHLFLTLASLFRDIGKLNGNEALGELGTHYQGLYESEWRRVKGAVDWSDTGRADDPDRRETPRGDAISVNAPLTGWGGFRGARMAGMSGRGRPVRFGVG
jgi:hypothetical protein